MIQSLNYHWLFFRCDNLDYTKLNLQDKVVYLMCFCLRHMHVLTSNLNGFCCTVNNNDFITIFIVKYINGTILGHQRKNGATTRSDRGYNSMRLYSSSSVDWKVHLELFEHIKKG